MEPGCIFRMPRRTATAARRQPTLLLLGSGELGKECVIKPVMSSSGKGQSVARTRADLARSWKYAIAGMRGDKRTVIAEEFIDFDYEITLLTVKQRTSAGGRTVFVRPLGHRQERGDYQESWMPCWSSPRFDATRAARNPGHQRPAFL